MKIIAPKIIIPNRLTQQKLDNPDMVIDFLADSARVSYQSFEKKNGMETERRLVKNCVKSGHMSILEHDFLTFDFITGRAISMELIRHRMASYVQESTRYVKYDDELEFIEPIFKNKNPELFTIWHKACEESEKSYKLLRASGAAAQEARNVLNNSFKTHIRITRNFRAMREFLDLRCAKGAHPEIKILAIPLLMLMKEKYPEIFEDIGYDEEFAKTYIPNWKDFIVVHVEDDSTKIKLLELVEE